MKDCITISHTDLAITSEVMASGGNVHTVAKSHNCSTETVLLHVQNIDNGYMPKNVWLGRGHDYFTLWRDRGVPERVANQQAVYERWIAIRRMRFVAKASYRDIGLRFGLSLGRVKVILSNKAYERAFKKPPIVTYFDETNDLQILANRGDDKCFIYMQTAKK